jgi:hypothetical protein
MDSSQTVPQLHIQLHKLLTSAKRTHRVQHAIRMLQAHSGQIVEFEFQYGDGVEFPPCVEPDTRYTGKLLALLQTVMTAMRSARGYADLVRLHQGIRRQLPSFRWDLSVRLVRSQPRAYLVGWSQSDRIFLKNLHIAPD